MIKDGGLFWHSYGCSNPFRSMELVVLPTWVVIIWMLKQARCEKSTKSIKTEELFFSSTLRGLNSKILRKETTISLFCTVLHGCINKQKNLAKLCNRFICLFDDRIKMFTECHWCDGSRKKGRSMRFAKIPMFELGEAKAGDIRRLRVGAAGW